MRRSRSANLSVENLHHLLHQIIIENLPANIVTFVVFAILGAARYTNFIRMLFSGRKIWHKVAAAKDIFWIHETKSVLPIQGRETDRVQF
jgi:hypothetical protein